MRALILLLATSWCLGYPALHEPVYVLLSQPVSPAQELTPAIPTHALQEAPSSSFSVSSPEEEEASHRQFSSLLAARDPLLKGGVQVPESTLVAEPVIEAFRVEDPVISGAVPVLDAFAAVEEGTLVVNEAFPMLETLTVIHENPIVNHGRLVAVTLTFLEDGNQSLKGASLVDSSIITRHEPPAVKAASPKVDVVPVKNPQGSNVALNEVPTQAKTTAPARDEAVDYTPLVMTTPDSVADRAHVVEATDPVVELAPVVKVTPHALKPVPVVEAPGPAVDPAPVPKDAASVADPVPIAEAAEPVVEPVPVAEATLSVVDTLSVVENTAPVPGVEDVAPVPVVKAVAPVAIDSPLEVAAAKPLFVAEPPMPSAATPFIGGQFHAQNEAGQYSFGHWGGLNTRVENRDSLGRTSGSFAYVDPEGGVQVRKYVAGDGAGFRVAASDLPLEADFVVTEDLVGRPVVSSQ